MSFLEEIRKQPRHHREIMFGLCVITTLSLVGMVWYNSFEKNLYVLLNPGENADQGFLAENKENQTALSLLGNIGQTGKELKATLYNIFNLNSDDQDKDFVENTNVNDSGRVYMLPLSDKK